MPARDLEFRRMLEEYVAELRALDEKLRRKFAQIKLTDPIMCRKTHVAGEGRCPIAFPECDTRPL